MTMAIAPIGRLTQNTRRQDMYWIRKAPRDGPMTAATPKTEETRPCTRARSCGV